MTTVQFPRDLFEKAAHKLSDLGQSHISEPMFQAILDQGEPVLADDREAFEEYYARHFSKATGRAAMAADIKAMRDGENYGGARAFLNGQWAGWKARGAPQPNKYDDTLLPFLALMRNELHANAHKGDREGWLRMSLEQALAEIRHHADKLIVPVMNHDREAMREHAADVANCAMMLADIAGALKQ